jgi:hypothetical protein
MPCDDAELAGFIERSVEHLLELQLAARSHIAAAAELATQIERLTTRLVELRLATPRGASLRARADVP